ncbi:hypothetical protein HanRHA438_Chr15g0717511 [Helianthus annuus]|nr:hypothetical protein HanRHA438_Chr15g0717511 [Helianthus annuus]
MAFECRLNSLRAYLERRFDFLTAESPMMTTLKRYSSPSSSDESIVMCVRVWGIDEDLGFLFD